MGNILDGIKGPDDIKNLTDLERNILCGELRERIIATVSNNGGHLASNLGVIELTVALLSVFSPPKDSVIWDVGHQCYAYKLLTGRNKEFDSIRTEGGLSGFPSREESECDLFTTGHSSASISSAYGVSTADKLLNIDGFTIAVIGDGALTGGLAYEGLNNAGRCKRNFIVILNDNDMSISKNVGSMAKYLGYIRTKPQYQRAKQGVENVVKNLPVIGMTLAVKIRRFKNWLKKTIYNSTIFEDMGFSYYGPFDGHDLPKLIDTLNNAKHISKPILIHIKTTKGKGYDFAESNPNIYHGVSSFDAFSGKMEPSKQSFSSTFGKCICNLAYSDPRICAVTAAMGSGTGLSEFSSIYKERFFDVGIAEEHAVTFSAGLARKGMIPFFAVYSTFLQRAYDNLVHDVSLQGIKVILAVDRAGVVGEDGKTHHGLMDVAFLRSIPGITIFSPSYFDELDADIQNAVTGDYGLVAIRYPRGGEGYRPDGFVSQYGDFDVYGDKDADICMVTYGRVFSACAEACDRLLDKGFKVKVLKLNKLMPMSKELVSEAMSSKKIIFFEEGVKSGGMSECFASSLAEANFAGSVDITAVDNCFIAHAPMERLLAELHLDSKSVYKKISEMIKDE